MGKHINRKPLRDHVVGYGRTPEHTRFPHQQKRQRKKPKPRQITTRQVMAEFFVVLEQPVTVTRNGKSKKVSARAAIYQRLISEAAQGKQWAVRRVVDMEVSMTREYEAEYLAMLREFQNLEAHQQRTGRPLSPEAQALKHEIARRLKDPRELFDDEE